MSDNSWLPSRLKDLLDPVGRKLGLEGATDTGRLFARWSRIVGEHISGHAEPTSLRDGVLRVRADSPAWATELGYLSAEITERINRDLGRALVTEIRVWTGPPKDSRTDASQDKKRAPVDAATAIAREPAEDPREALERARAAARRRGAKTGPDQDF